MDNSNYNFENQLELGETLLRMGRIDEAERELRKAKVLSDAGEFSTAEDDPERIQNIQRLSSALAEVESILSIQEKRSRLYYWLSTAALATLLVGFITAWVLQRGEVAKIEDAAKTVEARSGTEIANIGITQNEIQYQSTRQINELQRLSAELTVSARVIDAYENSFQDVKEKVEDQDIKLDVTIPAVTLRPSDFPTPESDIVPAFTLSESGEIIQIESPTPRPEDRVRKLTVTTDSNIRTGPGLSYSIVDVAYQDDSVDVMGQSEDKFWYQIQNDSGKQGWIHISLVSPEGLPVVSVPTNTPEAPTFTPQTATRVPTSTPQPIIPTWTPVPSTREVKNTPVEKPLTPSTLIPRPTDEVEPTEPGIDPLNPPTWTPEPEIISPTSTPIPIPTSTPIPIPTSTPSVDPTAEVVETEEAETETEDESSGNALRLPDIDINDIDINIDPEGSIDSANEISE